MTENNQVGKQMDGAEAQWFHGLYELFKRAGTAGERELLLLGIELVTPEKFQALKEFIIRAQLAELSLSQLFALVAAQHGASAAQVEIMVRDLIFLRLINRSKLETQLGTLSAPPTHGSLQDRQERPVEGPPAPAKISAEENPGPGSPLVARLVPPVRIQFETQALKHQFPPPDLERHPGLNASGTEDPGHHGHSPSLLPRGVGE